MLAPGVIPPLSFGFGGTATGGDTKTITPITVGGAVNFGDTGGGGMNNALLIGGAIIFTALIVLALK